MLDIEEIIRVIRLDNPSISYSQAEWIYYSIIPTVNNFAQAAFDEGYADGHKDGYEACIHDRC